MKKLLFILLSLFLLTSCSSTFQLIQSNKTSIKMELDRDILVTTCKNGFFEDTEYTDSGIKTTKAVENKLRRYANTVTVISETSFSKIDKQQLLTCNYVIIPELYLWEDRATSWSGKPDKMMLGLTVYDNTGTKLNHIEIKGESTSMTLDDNDPIELVNEALDMYIRTIFDY